VAFLKRWISSQKRDLEVILGEASRPGVRLPSALRADNAPDDIGLPLGDEWRKGGEGGIWGGQGARESVGLFLARGGRH